MYLGTWKSKALMKCVKTGSKSKLQKGDTSVAQLLSAKLSRIADTASNDSWDEDFKAAAAGFEWEKH